MSSFEIVLSSFDTATSMMSSFSSAFHISFEDISFVVIIVLKFYYLYCFIWMLFYIKLHFWQKLWSYENVKFLVILRDVITISIDFFSYLTLTVFFNMDTFCVF
jgi:hypothetical protein